MQRLFLFVIISIAYAVALLPAMAKSKKSMVAEVIVEPTFPEVTPGTLPVNLKNMRFEQAFQDRIFDIAQTPTMCLARLSALVGAAGGAGSIKQYLSSAKNLNVSFQSIIGGEIVFHCAGSDGSAVPNRHLYSVDFSIVTHNPRGFLDIVNRVGARLYGWKTADLDARFVECTDKAKRGLQEDAFGVIPQYGSVRGMECYMTETPKLVLYAPDAD
jgi:hypothetical protein